MIDVSEFETRIGFKLPNIYREFLMTKNGGSCKKKTILLDNGIEVLCDQLYGLNKIDELDLDFWYQEFGGELPSNCVIIGSDPGGGIYLLIKAGSKWQVMYYDHQYSFESSSGEENTYKAEISLENLLNLSENNVSA